MKHVLPRQKLKALSTRVDGAFLFLAQIDGFT
jgi:hypothetical protein